MYVGTDGLSNSVFVEFHVIELRYGHPKEMSMIRPITVSGPTLFTIVVLPMSLAVLLAMRGLDLDSAYGVSSMIQFSVQLAVPWLFIAFFASSCAIVFPGKFTRWILRNRRIFGLCFAAGMAWQLLFILWLVVGHFDYYMEEAYDYLSLVEQVPGYIVLLAMTITSFRFGRSKLSTRQWKFLHKGGIYFLWFVVWTTYWYELFYYDDIQFIDYLYYWLGFVAWLFRMTAWTLKRVRQPAT